MKKVEINSKTFFVIGEKDAENWDIISRAKEIKEEEKTKKVLWFHLDNHPSSHVILICEEDLTTEQIEMAAAACKAHSKQKKALNVSVVYGPIEGVWKNEKGKAGSVLTNDKMMKRMKV